MPIKEGSAESCMERFLRLFLDLVRADKDRYEVEFWRVSIENDLYLLAEVDISTKYKHKKGRYRSRFAYVLELTDKELEIDYTYFGLGVVNNKRHEYVFNTLYSKSQAQVVH